MEGKLFIQHLLIARNDKWNMRSSTEWQRKSQSLNKTKMVEKWLNQKSNTLTGLYIPNFREKLENLL